MYVFNVNKQFELECTQCYESKGLFLSDVIDADAADVALIGLFDMMNDDDVGKRNRKQLQLLLADYENHGSTRAQDVVNFVADSTSNPTRACLPLSMSEFKYDSYQRDLEFGCLTKVCMDFERRATLTMTIYCDKRFRRIHTPCCGSSTCFVCQVDGHTHLNLTCEEVIARAVYANGIFCCPQCLVPTIRVGGCEELLCVCGRQYKIDEGIRKQDD